MILFKICLYWQTLTVNLNQKRTLVFWDWKVQLRKMSSKCNLDLVKLTSCMLSCPYYCFSSFIFKLNLLSRGTDNFYSFPESLGDELIIEILDSKAQHFGRVHAQVATIADDPVIFLNPNSTRWINKNDYASGRKSHLNVECRLTSSAGSLSIVNPNMSL